MSFSRAAALLVALAACGSARAGVVINEILYHPPNDREGWQFIELHNPAAQAADLGGWKLAGGVQYEFPAGTRIAANGYLVVAKSPAEFRKHYGSDAAGPFRGLLRHKGARLELLDAAGKKVDAVHYRAQAPWPVAAHGYSASLERICPTAPGNRPENWAPSPLPPGPPRAAGSPGRQNANYAPHMPPAIANVAFTPGHAAPDQEVKVEADVRSPEGLRAVELRYRVAGSGFEKPEQTVAMMKGAKDRYSARIPPQKAGQIVRFRVRAVDAKGGERFFPSENELRPALSVYVHTKFEQVKVPQGLVINVGENEFRAGQRPPPGGFRFGGPGANPHPRGKSAFVYVHPKTGEPELFDFINVTPRSAGRRVRLHKDHPLGDMTTFVLIFEPVDRFVLAEPLAYEVYRKAGNAACRTDFVRTWIDGRPLGYQLLIEQPNKAFLRHNNLRADGNLYKCQWFGNGVVGQHEKKTRVHEGHGDLVDVVNQLNRTRGAEQWAVIKKHFDVEQVATYFAVNMVLSHWDGYFNNYFAYHDVYGSGKWTLYPWDQDKTWGFHDGIRGFEVFTNMPLTFGMQGDRPPGWPKDRPPPEFFGAGPVWWRPGGHFSKPLLANPQFRKVFLARTKQILEKVYTEEVFFPLIKALGERLEPEVRYRAGLYREDPRSAVDRLHRNLGSLRQHLTQRRRFLLAQDEIRRAGQAPASGGR